MKLRYTTAGVVAVGSLAFGKAVADDGDVSHEQDEHYLLDEIVVEAAPLDRTVQQLAQPTSVLTGDLLESSQSSSIGETLANQVGVSASYFGPVSSRPVIRGQFGERVRVLTNGLDTLDASALSEDHAIGLDSILAERIEVIRGPSTLLYGSGASGGIVNVVDNRIHEGAPVEGFSGSLALGSDSAIGRESAAVSFDYGIGLVTLHADYFTRSTDNVDIPGFAESALLRALEEEEEEHEGEEGHEEEEEVFGLVENSDSETEGGSFALSLGDDDNWVGFSVSRYQSDYGVPGAHHHHHEEEEEGAHAGMEEEEEEEIIRIDLDQTRYDMRGGIAFGGNLIDSVDFRVSRNDYQHIELEGPEVGTMFDTQATDMHIELTHAPFGAVEGVIGLHYKNIDFVAEGDEAFVPPSDTSQFSVFFFEELAASDRLRLQFSGRAEHQEIVSTGREKYDDWAYGTSFGAVLDVSDTLTASAYLGIAERHPSSTELYAEGPHLAVQRFELGSETLGNGLFAKETATSLDLTLRGDYERMQFAVTGFTNTVDDYILLRPTAAEEDELQVFEFDQADVDFYGFEAELLFDIVDDGSNHLHARLVTDYVLGEESGSGAYLPQLTPLRYGASLHWIANRFDASVEAMYHDSQGKTAAEELPTDSYTLLSAEISTRLFDDSMLVFLRGTNLSDEDARRHTSPLKDVAPLPGRSIRAGIRWDF